VAGVDEFAEAVEDAPSRCELVECLLPESEITPRRRLESKSVLRPTFPGLAGVEILVIESGAICVADVRYV
jgi:hypothetical protein